MTEACPLWDDVNQRHDLEVKEAFIQATQQAQTQYPDLELPL